MAPQHGTQKPVECALPGEEIRFALDSPLEGVVTGLCTAMSSPPVWSPASCSRAQIVWAKQHFTLSRGDYHWKHESCWYAVREGKTSHWSGDRTQTTVWEIANNNPFGNPQREQSWGHGTQKPVECPVATQ